MLHGTVGFFFSTTSSFYYFNTLAMVELICYSVSHIEMKFIFQHYQIIFQSVNMHLNQ